MEPGYVPQYLYPTVVASATALPPESQMNYKMLLQFFNREAFDQETDSK